jgi:hypothetical protein
VFKTLPSSDGDSTEGRNFSQKRSDERRFPNARLPGHEDNLAFTV